LNPIIKVENLSKRYRLGLKGKRAKTLAGQMANMVKAPWENLKRLREMSRFGVEDESVFWALKDVNFEVKEGEVLGIIGKNGAGKSTLLKILSQITEPTSGRIEIHGRVASLLEVGTGFHPELSGRENIYMNGTILGMTRREIDSKLDEIVDFSGIEKFLDTAVKFYSSGMKVRLGFSVAAHLEPEILIIDEVLAVGDYEFQRKCLGKMEDVSKNQGRTVLFVSHQMDAIKSLCSTCLLLENGRFADIGGTDHIIERYLGESSFNLSRKFPAQRSGKFISYATIDHVLLNEGKLKISVGFVSDETIIFPVIGIVVYNQVGSPVFGSNPRFHRDGYLPSPVKSGEVIAFADLTNLHSGIYKVSIWFGNEFKDFDAQTDALTFELVSGDMGTQRPNPLSIGPLNQMVSWNITL
jgi:lipopolysaccharide transport system ATP-binding protein